MRWEKRGDDGMKKKEPTYCPLCGKEMVGEPYQCNFEHMAGRAGWHMTFEPRMSFFHECSQNLLNYLERWFKTCNKTNKYKKFAEEKKK